MSVFVMKGQSFVQAAHVCGCLQRMLWHLILKTKRKEIPDMRTIH
jgi:hypothetical protein